MPKDNDLHLATDDELIEHAVFTIRTDAAALRRVAQAHHLDSDGGASMDEELADELERRFLRPGQRSLLQ